MIISKDTQFFIYGYGARGRKIYDVLTRYQLRVRAYIDRKAAQYRKEGVNSYSLSEIKKTFTDDIEDSVIFIAVTNVFEHKSIANELYEQGFRYIIYKELAHGIYAKQINYLFDNILDVVQNTNIENEEIPQYETKESVQEESEGVFCNCNIPVNLLFGVTKKLYRESLVNKETELLEYITDKSLLYYTVVKGMLYYFANPLRSADWQRCKEIYFESRDAQTHVSPQITDHMEQQSSLKDRYNIFTKMDELFCDNPQFFYENPISVVWNEKGYFNIEDGNNRAAFLLEKGMRKIPCRMKREDYLLWKNDARTIDALQNCLENTALTLRAPITHPSFDDYQVSLRSYSYIKLQCICEYMWLNNINPSGLSILEINTQNDLCGSHMVRMGGTLTSSNPIEWNHINRLINHLLRIKNVTYIEESELVPEEKYDIVFCNDFTEEALKRLNAVSFKYLFGEMVNISEAEIQKIKSQFRCKQQDLLRQQLVGSDIYNIICFFGKK